MLLVFAGSAAALEQGIKAQVFENPIEKVVIMLQTMRQSVRSEGEAEKKRYYNFLSHCQNRGTDLESQVAAAKDRVLQFSTELEEIKETLKEVDDDMNQHQADRNDIKAAMAKATVLREKEAETFAAEKTDADLAKLAVAKAIVYIERGLHRGGQGSFAQTPAAAVLLGFVMDEIDRYPDESGDFETLLEFVSKDEVSVDGPKGRQVISALKQLDSAIIEDLADAIAAEEASIQQYDEFMASKRMEVQAMTASINLKSAQTGDLRVSAAQMKLEFANAEAALATSREALALLQKNCASKTHEWEQRSKTRSEELAVLEDAVNVLHTDNALDLLQKKQAGASSSFVQSHAGFVTLRTRALHEVRSAWRVADVQHKPALDFLALQLSNKRISSQVAYDKVISMCDATVGDLNKEQQKETRRKEYCETQLNVDPGKQQATMRALRAQGSKIFRATDMIAMLSEEIEALEVGLIELDRSIADATHQRHEDRIDFRSSLVSDAQARELLGQARNRLSRFYLPSSGSGATFVEIRRHQEFREVGPEDPPETWDAYSKKFEESSSAISMLDTLIENLDKDIIEAKQYENDSQADYEILMKDSASKRLEDSQVLEQKVEAKTDAEQALSDHRERKRGAAGDLLSTLEYIQRLRSDCDRLLEAFDERQTARMGEIDALVRAKLELRNAY